MMYHFLLEYLLPVFSPLRVVSYITFRTALAAFTAFAIGLILGPWLIKKLQRPILPAFLPLSFRLLLLHSTEH